MQQWCDGESASCLIRGEPLVEWLVSSGVLVALLPSPFKGVSLASPLAVMVVGKNTVVPFGFLLGDRPGDMMNGEMLPILLISSKNEDPLVNGELASEALVGRP